MQTGFISDMFSWRRMGFAEVGVKGVGLGQGKVRAARARSARAKGG